MRIWPWRPQQSDNGTTLVLKLASADVGLCPVAHEMARDGLCDLPENALRWPTMGIDPEVLAKFCLLKTSNKSPNAE